MRNQVRAIDRIGHANAHCRPRIRLSGSLSQAPKVVSGQITFGAFNAAESSSPVTRPAHPPKPNGGGRQRSYFLPMTGK